MRDETRARREFEAGLAHHQAGRHAQAVAAYRRSLAAWPGRASTLSNLGAALIQLGEPAAALQALDAALAAAPARADAHGHRAAARVLLGDDDAALADFDRALALGADGEALALERALTLNRRGRHEEALAALEALAGRRPGDAALALLQGQTLQQLGRDAAAWQAYQRALALDPALGPAWSRCGHLLRTAGRLAEAAAAYGRAIDAGDDRVANDFFRSACGCGAMAAAPPPDYLRELFDDYAPRFDAALVDTLHYRGHEAVVALVAAQGRAGFDAVLDLGCGTGLAAPLLRRPGLAPVRHLAGVDLAPRMIEAARARGLYDELEVGDAVAALGRRRADLVLACDLLPYLGRPEPLLDAAARALPRGGLFACSAEAGSDAETCTLQPTLRYRHGRPHLARLAAAAGFEVLAQQAGALRDEGGATIEGLYLCLRRQ
ncbi:MAG: methyltransferase domain-containing protein [Burkholderiales bacterium]|nr:methyltransferase domain-containing protein [Burkholderiales bacterium]